MSLLSFFGLSPSPSDDFWYGPVGPQTVAGIAVDNDVAMTYAACWACSGLLGTTGGMLPLKIMRILPNGGAEPARSHPTYELLYNPNDDMTGMMFRTSRILQQVNAGNCFAEIERDRIERAAKLHPIHASRIPPRNIIRKTGKLVYLVNNDDGTKTEIKAADMFHVPSWMSSDGIVGRGVVENARLTIAFGLATETQGAAYFGNSARPAVVIVGGKFKDKEAQAEYRRQWSEIHGGPANNARPALLPEGADIKTLEFSAEDSQFLETRQHNVEEVCRWYNVPPHMVQHLLRATYNNIEQMSLEFVKYSLMRWLVLWEQEIDRKLLTKEDRNLYFSKHIVEGLERADLQTRTTSLKDQFFNGEITLNEWRALEDRNPIGPSGDVHFVQQAMIPLDMAVNGPPQPAAPAKKEPLEVEYEAEVLTAEPPVLTIEEKADFLAQIRNANEKMTALETQQSVVYTELHAYKKAAAEAEAIFADEANASVAALREELTATQSQLARAMLRDVFSRLLSVEINAVKRVAEKPSRFMDRLSEFYAKHTATLERSLAEPVAVLLAATGSEQDALSAVRTIAQRHVSESTEQIHAILDCQPDELAAKVCECVEKWHERTVEL